MALDARTRALQVLETLYPDPAVRGTRAEELGESGLMTLGNHVLRQDEFSRNMNEIAGQRTAADAAKTEYETLYASNKEWWDANQARLAELETLKATVKGTPVVPDPAAPKVVTVDDLAQTERGAVAFIAESNRLTMEHFQKFGEILDISTLLADKRVQQIGLLGVYAEKFKPQLDARAAAQAAAAEQKIRDDERAKVLAAQASQHHPYPVRGNESSTLDGLERPADQRPAARSVDEMAAEYARLGAGRGVPV